MQTGWARGSVRCFTRAMVIAAAGWLAARAWHRPLSLAPTAVVIWLSTVAVGMLLRKASSQGTAVSFVVVASISLAILLLGWRLAVAALRR